MQLSDNRPLVLVADQQMNLLQYPDFSIIANPKTFAVAQAMYEKEERERRMANKPASESLLSNFISSYIVREVGEQYRQSCPLKTTTLSESVTILRDAVRAILSADSSTPAKGFLKDIKPMDPMKAELLVFNECEQNGVLFTRTYTLSTPMLIFGISRFGRLSFSWDFRCTQAYFCTTAFIFYLGCVAKPAVGLSAMLRRLDPDWAGVTPSAELEAMQWDGEGGKTYFIGAPQTMPYSATGDAATITLRESLIEEVSRHRKEGAVGVLCPFGSPYADAFVVAGQYLFLIRSREPEKRYRFDVKPIVEDLHMMGFECGTTEPVQKSKSSEPSTESRDFTTFLMTRLGLTCVVPVLISNAAARKSLRVPTTSGYDSNIAPVLFDGEAGLAIRFAKVLKTGQRAEDVSWAFSGVERADAIRVPNW